MPWPLSPRIRYRLLQISHSPHLIQSIPYNSPLVSHQNVPIFSIDTDFLLCWRVDFDVCLLSKLFMGQSYSLQLITTTAVKSESLLAASVHGEDPGPGDTAHDVEPGAEGGARGGAGVRRPETRHPGDTIKRSVRTRRAGRHHRLVFLMNEMMPSEKSPLTLLGHTRIPPFRDRRGGEVGSSAQDTHPWTWKGLPGQYLDRTYLTPSPWTKPVQTELG